MASRGSSQNGLVQVRGLGLGRGLISANGQRDIRWYEKSASTIVGLADADPASIAIVEGDAVRTD